MPPEPRALRSVLCALRSVPFALCSVPDFIQNLKKTSKNSK